MVPRQNSRRGILRTIALVVVIGLAANVGIAVFLDGDAILGALIGVRFWVVLVPFLCYAGIYVVDLVRLRLVLRQFGERIGLFPSFANGVLAVFFSNLTPMATGGQPYQVYHLRKNGIDTKVGTNLVLSRHVEYMMTSLAIVLVSLPRVPTLPGSLSLGAGILWAGILASTFFAFAFLALLLRPDWLGRLGYRIEGSRVGGLFRRISRRRRWAARFHAWSRQLKAEIGYLWSRRLGVMLVDVGLGFGNLLLQAFSLHFVVGFFAPAPVSYIDLFITFVVVNMVVYYIPTPGASGSIEGAYALVFAPFVGSAERGLSAILIWRLATYYLHLAFGFGVLLLSERRHHREAG